MTARILRSIALLCGLLSAAAGPEEGAAAREPDNRGAILYFTLAPELAYDDTSS
jgi:hypothetical protein